MRLLRAFSIIQFHESISGRRRVCCPLSAKRREGDAIISSTPDAAVGWYGEVDLI